MRETAARPACNWVAPIVIDVIGPMRKKRYSRNAMSVATSSEPDATRAPPTPRTARKVTCRAKPDAMPTTAE